jgi:hypothetical protein
MPCFLGKDLYKSSLMSIGLIVHKKFIKYGGFYTLASTVHPRYNEFLYSE